MGNRKLSDGACPEDAVLLAVLNRTCSISEDYMRGYEDARTAALNAINARAEMWREKDCQQPQITTGLIKARIAEDFECGEAVLRIGWDGVPEPTEQL